MIVLCAIWGLQQVAIKVAVPTVPAVLQAGIRSTIATVLVMVWMASRGQPVWQRDGTQGAGLLAGLLFAGEFACVFIGLTHTTASRMAVFLYTAPCFTALGLHWFVSGERLRKSQWVGIGLAFSGMLLAFADGLSVSHTGHSTWLGDSLGILAGILWAATTVLVRASSLADASPSRTLLYQLAVSSIALLALAGIGGHWQIHAMPSLVAASLLYQAVVVAFVSYLAWFWLLTRYMASRLSVFSFLTPLFGVTFGVLLLGDQIGPRFLSAAAMVLTGIALVNLRR
ncbi:DMT family transporter [Pandoraea sp.]|uniref:DMT family transporter n=1 Tax=Pandoraea sp. TaxID=1883445 RepID=UPI0012262C86|nr:DMT family transporter [Pandoraea sp.]MBU6494506.1 DMT family transporter [Burkholderiales bacterium]MDE2286963.1 DMT family transporter [Burkholderiales bacterium]MDE2611729.1 DMT family transporter [Burkholderiales bacterium]TAL56155.1 MAG: DMT family transporter [Pandoraea sp.]TAM19079.1 MAG: DMT family transporter [Pandoraea sp.]